MGEEFSWEDIRQRAIGPFYKTAKYVGWVAGGVGIAKGYAVLATAGTAMYILADLSYDWYVGGGTQQIRQDMDASLGCVWGRLTEQEVRLDVLDDVIQDGSFDQRNTIN